jgi:NADPH-dependent ferric siderophore reductase
MGVLTSRLDVPLDDPRGFLEHLKAHLPDAIPTDAGLGATTVIDLYGARTRLDFRGSVLRIDVEGEEAAALGIAKGTAAYYLQHILGDRCPDLRWSGDGAGTRELAHFREMRVVSAFDVTPRMRRVRLAGAELARFATGGLHVRLAIPPVGRNPVWPHAGAAALPVWPTGEDTLATRVYTIRAINPDAGHLDIDVALHEPPSVGCRWACEARPGDRVGILGPGGDGTKPAGWTLLLGDETALPAIARMLETLPANACGQAFLEVADAGEEQALRHPAGFEVHWLHRGDRPPGTTDLLIEAARSAAWPDEGGVYVWAAAEFEAFKAIRHHCRKERGLKKSQHLAVAYWRRGQLQGDDEADDHE